MQYVPSALFRQQSDKVAVYNWDLGVGVVCSCNGCMFWLYVVLDVVWHVLGDRYRAKEDDNARVRQPNVARRPPLSLVCYQCASLSSTFR